MLSINDQNLSAIRIIALTRGGRTIMPQERLVDGLTALRPRLLLTGTTLTQREYLFSNRF